MSTNSTKLISIIVPVYQEQDNILLLYSRLKKTLEKMPGELSFEMIFVNDGSKDKSGSIIQDIERKDPGVRYIEFSRNFGKEMATSAGIHHAEGDAAIIMDADLQHPPELIPEFIQKWQDGAEVVIGVRKNISQRDFLRRIGAASFYRTINMIGETEIVPHATDFRLINREVIYQFKRFTEKDRITRGLIDWLGFKSEHIYFDVPTRKNGEAYKTIKLIKLAMSSFAAHSLLPLKLAGYFGAIVTPLSGILGAYMIADKYIFSDPFNFNFSGPAMLVVFVVFLTGIILSSLGLVALYIANIHREVMNRPPYIMRDRRDI